MDDTEKMIAFKLPEAHKRALAMVAADKGEGTTVSSLLRDCVEQIIKSHRDGAFFDVTALTSEQHGAVKKARQSRRKKSAD